MGKHVKLIKIILVLFVSLMLSGNLVMAADTCMFEVSADDVPPNIVLLLDNGAEMENLAWHSGYDNSIDYTPAFATDGLDNDGDKDIDEKDGSEGFTNDLGYSIDSQGGDYHLVNILADLTADGYKNDLQKGSSSTTINSVVWAFYTFNGRTIRIPVVPSAAVDAAGIKDNAVIFRYSKNYLNWLFFGDYNVVGAGDGSDLDDKSRFYYAKKAIFTVAELTKRQAYFGIRAFTSTYTGAPNVQPLGFVYDSAGAVDSNFVNNINNLGAVTYSPLAEGLASVGEYYSSPSSATYTAAVGEYCQKNFVIVITSGMSSMDNNDDKFKVYEASEAFSVFTDSDADGEGVIPLDTGNVTVPTNLNGSTQLDDVAYYLWKYDIVPYQPGYQNITTYTIGFMGNPESNAYLKNASNNGNGNLNLYTTTDKDYGKYHFEVENPNDLSAQLLEAINSILSITSSFTAPVVPVTSTTSGNQIYLAFFKPIDGSNFWEGNVTKFGLSDNGEILSTGGNAAIWPNGAIKEDATPYWATINWADDSASNLPPNGNGVHNSSRHIYTYLGSSTALTANSNKFSDTVLTNALLDTYADATGPILLKNVTGTFGVGNTITGGDSGALATVTAVSGIGDISVSYSGKNSFNFRTGEVVTNGSGDVGTIFNAGTTEVINYIRGADVFDEDGDNNIIENRMLICGDPLHSEPVVVNYGDLDGDGNDEIMVFFGANDGMLHAVNDEDGTEAWSFVPPDLLPKLKKIIEESEHQYYVDSSPVIMRKDYNGNGKIDNIATYPDDKVYLVCGERKGGTSYFALDITDPANPEFLWRIAQTAGTPPIPPADEVIPELGESWPVPKFKVVKTSAGDTTGTDVVFIGGGYSETNAKGNTILAINAETGAIVKQFTVADNADMTYSIPSKISTLDRDLNGFVDKLYVGDMGGQLWRIGKFDPVSFPDSDEDINNWEVYKLFTARCNELSCNDLADNNANALTDDQDVSQFFYPPTVTLENNFDMVFIGSGNRGDACSTDNYNALYAIQDLHSDILVPSLDLNDLANADTSSLGYTTPDISGSDSGWYLVMEPGEKALSESLVFNKTLYTTTFLPNNEVCVPGGYAKLYAVDYLTGAPKFDLDGDGDVDTDDSSKVIGGGIPSKPVIVITSTGVAKLLISTSSTHPDAASLVTTAGVMTVDVKFPDINFHLKWWRELFD